MKRFTKPAIAAAALAAVPMAGLALADSHGMIGFTDGHGQIEGQHAVDHVRNLLTDWRYTDGDVGLVPVAIDEAQTMLQHANLAVDNMGSRELMQAHIGHVLHALDPALAANEVGRGFGVLPAAQIALDQVDLARQRNDGSQSINTHGTHVTESLRNVTEWSHEIAQRGRIALLREDINTIERMAQEIQSYAEYIVYGRDSDSDGTISWVAGEGGLEQVAQHMRLMVKGEPKLERVQRELVDVDMAVR